MRRGSRITRRIFERIIDEETKNAALADQEQPAWVKAAMRLIRRSQVVANPLRPPLVSVQPMPQPIGMIHFLRARYGRWEPSAVDRLAALAEPEGELAKRIAEFDSWGIKRLGILAEGGL